MGKKTTFKFGALLAFVLVVSLFAFSCGGGTTTTSSTTTTSTTQTQVKPIILVADTHMQESQFYFGPAYKAMLAEVEEKSGGRLIIQTHYNSELGFSFREWLKTIKEGLVDITYTPGSLGSAFVPELGYAGLPLIYGPNVPKQQLVPRYAALKEILWDEVYPSWNCVPLAVMGPLNDISSYNEYCMVKNVPDLDSMKGISLRVGTPEIGAFWANFGVSPTVIPSPDVYMALKTGMVDGTNIGRHMYLTTKYYEVAPYLMQFGKGEECSAEFGGWAINKNVFDKLSPDLQQILLDAYHNYEVAMLLYYEEWKQPGGFFPPNDTTVDKIIAEYNITVIQWSDADCARIQDAADINLATWLKGTTDLGRKLVESDLVSMGLADRWDHLVDLMAQQ
ncbi:MAG: TRAP transporter substrate-binding protein DctP [Dehalococcoidales bacterium]|nr:TRAP transporter substrate-binding protein DctP [Dehalococcoidales bacterium]